VVGRCDLFYKFVRGSGLIFIFVLESQVSNYLLEMDVEVKWETLIAYLSR
jgi:hypothetical protein